MGSRIIDKIPYDQKIINISHFLDDIKLIIKLRKQFLMAVRVTLYQSLMTQLIQISP